MSSGSLNRRAHVPRGVESYRLFADVGPESPKTVIDGQGIKTAFGRRFQAEKIRLTQQRGWPEKRVFYRKLASSEQINGNWFYVR